MKLSDLSTEEYAAYEKDFLHGVENAAYIAFQKPPAWATYDTWDEQSFYELGRADGFTWSPTETRGYDTEN